MTKRTKKNLEKLATKLLVSFVIFNIAKQLRGGDSLSGLGQPPELENIEAEIAARTPIHHGDWFEPGSKTQYWSTWP